jgi:hypothetical protein
MPFHLTRRFVALSALLVLSAASLAQDPQPEATLKVVKYDQLGDVIRQLRGKVIAVDFWADT